MTRTCAWCGKEMGAVPPLDDGDVTHGICKDCFESCLKGADDPSKAPDAGVQDPVVPKPHLTNRSNVKQ